MADLRDYGEKVAEEYGITEPWELVVTEDEEEEGFYPPNRVVIFKEHPSLMKSQIRHELAHMKLHKDLLPEEPYSDVEDLIRREVEANLFAYGKASKLGLEYLMAYLVRDWGLSSREAKSSVVKVAKAMGVPTRTVSAAVRRFRKFPKGYLEEGRVEE